MEETDLFLRSYTAKCEKPVVLVVGAVRPLRSRKVRIALNCFTNLQSWWQLIKIIWSWCVIGDEWEVVEVQ